MSRPRRGIFPSCSHHVVLKGIDSMDIFQCDRDYNVFLKKLCIACKKYKVELEGYCLMTNHVHLILRPIDECLSSCVQHFAGMYAKYFNEMQGRHGALYKGRYYSTVVQSVIYTIRVLRYVHLNPVKAGMVSAPEEYPWSSCNAFHKNYEVSGLNKEKILEYFGSNCDGNCDSNRFEAVAKLIDYTGQFIGTQEIQEIEDAIARGVFGDQMFQEQVKPELKYRSNLFLPTRKSSDEAIDFVCTHFNVDFEEL